MSEQTQTGRQTSTQDSAAPATVQAPVLGGPSLLPEKKGPPNAWQRIDVVESESEPVSTGDLVLIFIIAGVGGYFAIRWFVRRFA